MKVSQLNGTLTEIRDQAKKANAEILAKLTTLEGQLADADVPADAAATLADLKATVQAEDDIVPDAPPAV